MIEREKVIKTLTDALTAKENYPLARAEMSFEFIEMLLDLLKEHEAVTACWSDDVGHWIEGDRNGTDPSKRTTGEMIDTFRCTWCGFYQYWKTPYCPNCGAKMEGR